MNQTHTAIYVRQSVDRADSISLDTQEQLCRTELEPDEAVKVYRDQGYSGKNTDRPALRAMMQDISAGEISRVLVYKLDRISRNLADFTRLLQLFQRQRVSFSSHTERFETDSPMGQAMQSLLMVFAQLERETISGRVRDAAFSRAKMGFDTGGKAPFGFRKIPAVICGKRSNQLLPDEHAAQVQAAFSAYLTAESSLSSICADWNRQGFRAVRGGLWQSGTLRRVLRNPVYAQADARVYAYLSARGAELCVPDPLPEGHGVYLYADRRICKSRFSDLHGSLAVFAPHEGIIPAEIWLNVQKKLDSARKKRTNGKGQHTWLSGMIYCRRCGNAMTAVRGRSTYYLICCGKKRGDCAGAGAVWRTETAEQLVGEAIKARLKMQTTGGEQALSAEDCAAIRAELDLLTLRRERLIQALALRDDAEVNVIAAAAARLEARCKALRERLPVCAAIPPALPDWETLSFSEKRETAQAVLRCVLADGDVLYAVAKDGSDLDFWR